VKGQGTVLPRASEGQRLFQVAAGWDELSQVIQEQPHITVGLHEASRIVLALGQGEVLLQQLLGRLELPTLQIESP
jgi:hypothetical protein